MAASTRPRTSGAVERGDGQTLLAPFFWRDSEVSVGLGLGVRRDASTADPRRRTLGGTMTMVPPQEGHIA